MKKAYLQLITAVTLVLFSACAAKDAGDDLPTLSARISITSPSNNAQFTIGDTITIAGRAVDEKGIKALSVKVYHSQYDTLISNVLSSAPNLSTAPFSGVFVHKDSVELNAYFLVKSINSVEVVREERVSFHVHGIEH